MEGRQSGAEETGTLGLPRRPAEGKGDGIDCGVGGRARGSTAVARVVEGRMSTTFIDSVTAAMTAGRRWVGGEYDGG